MTLQETIEQAAREMFAQHHGPKTTTYRPWDSVDRREHAYWLSKAEIGVRVGREFEREKCRMVAAIGYVR